jgi:MFS superfamily sulfate permease-like transporter
MAEASIISALSNSIDAESVKTSGSDGIEVEQNDGIYFAKADCSTGEDGSALRSHRRNEDYGDSLYERGVENLYADLSCLCLPTCAKDPREICSRTGGWMLANADQFISSIIVAISLIPESISYALIAGLPPSAGLQSCWITNIITAIIGGRPGMISSASGMSALLLHRLIQTDTIAVESGIMFVPYVIIFAGILQCIAAFFGLSRLVSAFPATVVVGIVNAMALLILALQCRYVKELPLNYEEMENGWNVDGSAPAVEISWNIPLFSYFGEGLEWIAPTLSIVVFGAEAAAAFVICTFLPKWTTSLPATLVGLLVVFAVEFGLARQFGAGTPLIGDYGGAKVRSILFVSFR